MESKALEAAHAEYVTAARALHDMKSAPDIDELVKVWVDFLYATTRAWNRLKQASVNEPAKHWFGQIVGAQRGNELLTYVLQARDARDHGIEQIVKLEPAHNRITNKDESKPLHIGRMEFRFGQLVSVDPETAKNMKITVVPGKVHLLPVTNRSATFPVPTQHLGKPITDPNPITVAELALEYLRNCLSDRVTKFGWPIQ